MKTIRNIFHFTIILFTSFIHISDASVVYFEANWSGVPNGNSATATALVGIDTAFAPNPGDSITVDTIPSWFDSITLTITGASFGNGIFTKNDFEGFLWDTEGATLDFDSELVGQTTTNAPWGTTSDGTSGDFNLFRATSNLLAPTGTTQFELTPSGSSDRMNLTSFIQIPEPATLGLLGTFGGVLIFTRRVLKI